MQQHRSVMAFAPILIDSPQIHQVRFGLIPKFAARREKGCSLLLGCCQRLPQLLIADTYTFSCDQEGFCTGKRSARFCTELQSPEHDGITSEEQFHMRVGCCSCSFVDRYGLLIQRFCLLVLSLSSVQVSKVAEDLAYSGMVVLSQFLKNGAGSSQQRLCLIEAVESTVEDAQVPNEDCCIDMM